MAKPIRLGTQVRLKKWSDSALAKAADGEMGSIIKVDGGVYTVRLYNPDKETPSHIDKENKHKEGWRVNRERIETAEEIHGEAS